MEALGEQLIQLLFKVRNLGAFATTRLDACPEDLDINMTEFLLLRKVAEKGRESRLNLVELQKSFGITKSGASKMLATLEKKGCLERDTDKINRRNLIVRLTEKGCEAVKSLRNYVDEAFTEYIRRIGESELKQAIAVIGHLEKESNAVRDAIQAKNLQTRSI